MELSLKEAPTSSSRRPMWLSRGVTALAVLLILAGIAGAFHSVRGNSFWLASVDFGCYVKASHLLTQGRNPYNSVPDESAPQYYGKPDSFGYGYPPVLAEMLAPSLLAGDAVTRYGWFLLSAGLLFGAIILLLRGFETALSWPLTLLACGIVSVSGVVRNDLYHGQANFLLLFLLIWGLWLLKKGEGTKAGLVWGLMVVTKPFLGILILYLLRRREYRAAGICLASGAMLMVLSFAPLFYHGQGWASVHGWMTVSHWYSSWARPDNFSLHGLFLRVFSVNPYTVPWMSSPMAAASLNTLSVLILAALFLLAVPFKELPAPSSIDAGMRGALILTEAGLVLGLCMTFGPLTEGDHLLLLLPGLVGVWKIASLYSARSSAGKSVWKWTMIGWALFFVLELNPFRGLPQLGLPSPKAWTPVSGGALLWTGQVAAILAIMVLLLANALRQTSSLKIRAESIS